MEKEGQKGEMNIGDGDVDGGEGILKEKLKCVGRKRSHGDEHQDILRDEER